jgi:hypothetical protein
MGRGGPKNKAGKGEGVVADRTRHNGNKRGIAALQSKFVPPAQAKAKAGVGAPKAAFDSGSSVGSKEAQASSSPSPSKKKKKRQSKSPVIDAEAMKELLSTTKLFSSPSKQKEFKRKVKGILSSRDNFPPTSSVESTPTASPAPMMPKKHQQEGKKQATHVTAVAELGDVVLESTSTPAAVSSSSSSSASSSRKAKSGSLSKGKNPPRKGNLNHQRLKDCQRVVMTAVGTAVLTDHGSLSKGDQDKTALRLCHGIKGLNKHPEIQQEKHLDHDDATGRPV